MVVDDSPTAREFLTQLLDSDPGIEVVGTAADGDHALEIIRRTVPDVVTMDINMPKLNGFASTRRIMEVQPTPIVIVTGSWDTSAIATTFRAMEAGAVAVVPRPPGPGHPDHERSASELLELVKAMSEVKVVTRWPSTRPGKPEPPPTPPTFVPPSTEVEVVAVGASTGGPTALQALLRGLPTDYSTPILIVQHMAVGFVAGFAKWLGETSGRRVAPAVHGEPILPGRVYLAPDRYDLEVDRSESIALRPPGSENGLCPSAAALFDSVTKIYGPRAVGVLLTGMGRDGAEELKILKDRGALTFAQDPESSVVHGMPGEAIRLGGATYVLSPQEIAAALATLAKNR